MRALKKKLKAERNARGRENKREMKKGVATASMKNRIETEGRPNLIENEDE